MAGRKYRTGIKYAVIACTVIILISTSMLSVQLFGHYLQPASAGDIDSSKTQYTTPPTSRTTGDVVLENIWSLYVGPTNALAWGDMDKDGFLDLAIGIYDLKVQVFKNRNGTLDKTPTWNTASNYTATSLAWGDMDGDGYLELAVGCGPEYTNTAKKSVKYNVVYKNINGKLGALPTWRSGDRRNTSDIAWVDIDNDGYLDLVASNFGIDGKNVIYENHQGNLISQPSWSTTLESWTEALACGDIDNDGDHDIVFGNNHGEPIRHYKNNGGTFPQTPSWSGASSNTLDIALGDLNNNGYLDIATGSGGSKMCTVYYNNNGAFGSNYDWSSTGTTNSNSNCIALGDVDSDGDLDLAAGCIKNGIRDYNIIMLNDQNTLQDSAVWRSQDAILTAEIAFADIDNDGDLDLSFANNGTSESNKIYSNNIDKLPPAFSLLPNDPPYCKVITPKDTRSGTISINCTIYDDESDPVLAEFLYSIDDGPWQPALELSSTRGRVSERGSAHKNLAASPSGEKYEFLWDTQEIDNESKNVWFRILVHPKSSKLGIYQYATVTATTKQFSYGELPSMVTEFRAAEITTHSVLLVWNQSPEDEKVFGYELYINITNSTSEFMLYKNITDDANCLVPGLVENTSYYFKILAYDAVYFCSDPTDRICCSTFNKPPIVNPSYMIRKITIAEDEYDNTSIKLESMFHDPTNDLLRFEVVKPNNLSVAIKNSGAVHIKPKENWFGTEALNFSAADGQWHSPTEPSVAWNLVEVVVTSVNDRPMVKQQLGTLELDEDPEEPGQLDLLEYFADWDKEDKLNFRATGQKNINVAITDLGQVVFMPMKDWHGIESINITASDNKSEVTDTIQITVNSVNDRPEIMPSSLNWEVGGWWNYTFEVEDADVEDTLEFSTDLSNKLPGAIFGKNFIFNTYSGDLSVLVSQDMVGTYRFNISVSDGSTTVTKMAILTINEEETGENGRNGESDTEQNFMLITIIIIVMIVILAVAGMYVHKKRSKISMKTCPKCGQTMIQKGKGAFKCTACNTTIDASQEPVAPEPRTTPPAPNVPKYEELLPDQGGLLETTKVEGGHYPKSILEGSVLDKPDLISDVPAPPTGPLPVAIPLTQTPQQLPALPAAAPPTPAPVKAVPAQALPARAQTQASAASARPAVVARPIEK